MMETPSRGHVVCYIILLFTCFILLDYYSSNRWDRDTYEAINPVYAFKETISKVSIIQSRDHDIEAPKLILTSHNLSPSSNNIFFVETSCAFKQSKKGLLVLNSKQACAIFSAAFYNPSRKVILFYTCPLVQNYYARSSEVVKNLLDLPNFSVAAVNLSKFYIGTPLEPFLTGILQESLYPIEHNADLLRILLVYQYGGTYMDLDVISTRSLDKLGVNYIGAQQRDQLGTGVLNFEANHNYLKDILVKSFDAYIPQEWAAVGPVLATSVLRDYCNITETTNLETVGLLTSCNITVYSNQYFYPIRYPDWKLYYENDTWPLVKTVLSNTYVVHVWNHMSGNDASVVVGSNQPYAKLAEQHCSPVYKHSGSVFI